MSSPPLPGPSVAVLNDYQGVARELADWDRLGGSADVQFFHTAFSNQDEAAQTLAGFEIVCAMRERQAFGATLLQRLPCLRLLVTTGSANRSIDLDAARTQGVVVCGTRDGLGQRAAAEHTWALILAAAKNLPAEERALRHGRWQTRVGRTVFGQTLGILGLGGVGRLVAGYGRAFGLNVLAWSPSLTDTVAAEAGVTRVALTDLLSGSDIVSVHIAETESTRGLINAEALKAMRATALLINTSRGPIVDESALADALTGRAIAGAALDVFDIEPLPAGHPFRTLSDNLILTPHLGYVCEDVYRTFYGDTLEDVESFLSGSPIRVLT